ncbi:MAG: hypothetical protein J0I32_04695 [Sphingobacteriales bacterium]|nr:hypothetical protein [Sphingobacteriales bacterium]OJV98457.1 MAG: hypothetical protein BGO52_11770 [Sphingobacteriales bacterium 44-61]
MEAIQHLRGFFEAIAEDPRITPTHISLYCALFHYWLQKGCVNPVTIIRNEVMNVSKISGRTTYQKYIQELQEYGYIKYEPSFNHFLGSLISLPSYPECVARIITK